MYAILVYDINVDRLDRVRIFLKQYLNWVQNSVFEGELTKVELKIIENRIKQIINENEDSVRIYVLRSDKYLDRINIGVEKANLSEII
jgi:CRISPR-associated protein Cas2